MSPLTPLPSSFPSPDMLQHYLPLGRYRDTRDGSEVFVTAILAPRKIDPVTGPTTDIPEGETPDQPATVLYRDANQIDHRIVRDEFTRFFAFIG